MRYGRRSYRKNFTFFMPDWERDLYFPFWQERIRDRERYLTGFIHALGLVLVWIGLVALLNH
jgi:hypothetical protein